MLYPTALGLLLCFGSVVPFALGNFTVEHTVNFITGLIILVALISGWRILFWVLMNGPKLNIKIHKVWWLFAITGASVTLVSWMFVALEELEVYSLPKPNPTQMFVLGVYFIIPFAHIIGETCRQKALTSHSS